MADLQVVHNKAARIELDLSQRAPARDTLARLHWKTLAAAEQRIVQFFFTYKLVNNLFAHSFSPCFKSDFHYYNTRSRNNIRKSSTIRRLGHWSTINFC